MRRTGHGGDGRGGGGEVHERGVRRAGPGGGGLEEGLAAAIRRLRRALRQVRVGVRAACLLRYIPPKGVWLEGLFVLWEASPLRLCCFKEFLRST